MSETTSINIRKNAEATQVSDQFDSYSRVTIVIDDDHEISVGTDTGRELVLSCPWGTEQMAQNLLDSLHGFQYQPYAAESALVHPAMELGDALTVNGIMGGIYSQSQTFGRLMQSTVSAPHEEEIDHEFPYIPPKDRQYKRQLGNISTTFSVAIGEIRAEVSDLTDDMNQVQSELVQQAGEISAKVSKTGGDRSSFGWTLTDSSWELFSGNRSILKATSAGLEVSGKVTATSGYIGNGSAGFTIGQKAIYNGITSLTDEAHTGIYLGTDGIRLGKGIFTVTSSGALTAKTADLTGKVTATSGYIGTAAAGFKITQNAIMNGKTSIGDANPGVYIGTSGISLGASNAFKVDSNGNLTASKGTFSGAVYASSIKCDEVDRYGGSFSGKGLSSGSVAKGKTTSSVQSTLSQVATNQADIAAFQEMLASIMRCNALVASTAVVNNSLTVNAMRFDGHNCDWTLVPTSEGSVYCITRA